MISKALVDERYKQIGQLKVENDFLKKIFDGSALDAQTVDSGEPPESQPKKAM